MQRKGTRYQAAHGKADHRGLGQLQVVEQFQQLVGVTEQRRAGGRAWAGAVAEHVVADHAVIRGQANHLAAPHFFIQAHAVDQNHRLALAGRHVTGASRCVFRGEPNHGALLHAFCCGGRPCLLGVFRRQFFQVDVAIADARVQTAAVGATQDHDNFVGTR